MRDLLLISDLHLGSHLKRRSRGEFVHLAARIEQDFPRFLEHYRGTGHWQLVINGDFIDFWNVETEDTGDPETTAVERLHLVLDEHSAVEDALVRFLEAGHGVVFVTGNHDAEFLYPKVRRALVERLEGAVARADASITATGTTRIDTLEEGRVRFVEWFLREPGGVWIEHGHLFDPACRTGSILAPTRRGRLVQTVAEVATRRFTNLMPEIGYDAADHFSGLDYVRWATARGLRFMVRVLYYYLRMSGAMLGLWARSGREDEAARREHEEKLERVATNAGLQMSALTTLQQMAPPPTSASVWGVLSVTQLDAVFSFLLPVVIAYLAGQRLGVSTTWALVAGAALGALAVVGVLRRRRPRDVARDMLEVAASIGDVTEVPLVLMGHSHHGSLDRLGGVVYGNSGSWLDGSHLVVWRRDGELRDVELRTWRNGGVMVAQSLSLERETPSPMTAAA